MSPKCSRRERFGTLLFRGQVGTVRNSSDEGLVKNDAVAAMVAARLVWVRPDLEFDDHVVATWSGSALADVDAGARAEEAVQVLVLLLSLV